MCTDGIGCYMPLSSLIITEVHGLTKIHFILPSQNLCKIEAFKLFILPTNSLSLVFNASLEIQQNVLKKDSGLFSVLT